MLFLSDVVRAVITNWLIFDGNHLVSLYLLFSLFGGWMRSQVAC